MRFHRFLPAATASTAINVPSKLARCLFLGERPGWCPTARIQRGPSDAARCASAITNAPSKLARCLFSRTGTRTGPLAAVERGPSEGARSGSTGPVRVPVLPSHHVSIISSLASNSCPQAVQRMQSDSTVNSSDLMPIPPQSGQRARWTLRSSAVSYWTPRRQ